MKKFRLSFFVGLLLFASQGSSCLVSPPSAGICGAVACNSGQTCVKDACVYLCAAGETACADGCVSLKTSALHCGSCQTRCSEGEACEAGACVLRCRPQESLCQSQCVLLQIDAAHCGACGKACPAEQVCRAGQCALVCVGGTTVCEGACVDLQTHPSHCGACKAACPASQTCRQGRCTSSCPSGWQECSGTCVHVQTDAAHCGGCGKACSTTQRCEQGRCVEKTEACPSGLQTCQGRCTDTQLDPKHCGACDQACNADKSCIGGQCALVCGGGTSLCGGACVSLQSDAQHCGGCGKACSTGETCVQGACRLVCPQGTAECGGACVALQSDVRHCGGCSKACGAGETCQNGVCSGACVAGESVCNGRCVDTQSHPLHCGGCGQACGAGLGCSKGSCLAACQVGETNCGGSCASLQTSVAHCGGCGKGCASGDGCCGGVCFDLQRDSKNCGTCGNLCPAGQHCLLGRCAVDSWALKAGGTGNERGQTVFVDSNRNLYVAGVFQNSALFGTTLLTATGTRDSFVAKISPSGAWLFLKPLHGTTNVEIYHLGVDASGAIYVAGTLQGSVPFGTTVLTTSPSRTEIFVAKMDPQGNWLWAKKSANTASVSTPNLKGLQIDLAGNLFIAGYAFYSFSLDSLSFVLASGQKAPFVAKIDPQGNWVWGKVLVDSAESAEVHGMALDSAGNLFFAGIYSNSAPTFGTFSPPRTSSSPIAFLGKMNAQGTWQWLSTFEPTWSPTRVDLLRSDAAGNLYMAGTYTGKIRAASMSYQTQGGSDLFVAKSDSQGRWQWLASAGGAGSESSEGLTIDSRGGVWLVGKIGGAAMFRGIQAVPTTGTASLFVAKADPQGMWTFVQTIPGSSSASIYAFTLDSAWRTYLCGSFRGTLPLQPTPISSTSNSDDDMFCLKGHP